jgi:hypothetical protein
VHKETAKKIENIWLFELNIGHGLL